MQQLIGADGQGQDGCDSCGVVQVVAHGRRLGG